MRILFGFILTLAPALAQSVASPSFPISYVASDAVYIRGGTAQGLSIGYRLSVTRKTLGAATMSATPVAEIIIEAVASSSSVCRITSQSLPLLMGDTATLYPVDFELLQLARSSSRARRYAQVITFTAGDPIEEELRSYVPRPPLPEVNRVRGRLTFEQNAIRDNESAAASSQSFGVSLRTDMTRVGGTYWNLSGYWRARLNQRHTSTENQTLADLINRTYHIGMYYANPQSRHSAGFGRLLLPFASSLDTIDGGYYGYRLRPHITVGAFGGSTPDPTSWNYAADRQMSGVYAAFERGSFDAIHYNGSAGLALTRRRWRAEREFLFLENTLLFHRGFTVFHSLQADRQVRGRLDNTEGSIAISRSFLTLRAQPTRWLSLDANHNHFRGIPTFDTRLIGTGLLDKYLFEGWSWGARLELPHKLSLYGTLGRSKRDTDTSPSWNQMQGLLIRDFFDSRLRIDIRRSIFRSSFGAGQYYTASFSRDISNRLRWEFQAGKQNFQSSLSSSRRTIFISGNLEWFLGEHYTLGAGYMLYRGPIQNYDQYFTNLGYRF